MRKENVQRVQHGQRQKFPYSEGTGPPQTFVFNGMDLDDVRGKWSFVARRGPVLANINIPIMNMGQVCSVFYPSDHLLAGYRPCAIATFTVSTPKTDTWFQSKHFGVVTARATMVP